MQTCTMPQFNYLESGTQPIDMLYMSHVTKYQQYYKVQQSQRTHRNYIRLSRFAWTTHAKSPGKICYIAGVHNTGPAGKCGLLEVWKWHAGDLLNAVNAFQGKLKHIQQQLSTDNMMMFKSMSSFINKTQTDLVPDFEKYVKMCVKTFVKTFQNVFKIWMARRRKWICFTNHSVWT